MSLSAGQLTTFFPSPKSIAPPLSAARVSSLRLAAATDAAWAFRSCVLSVVVGIDLLQRGFRSWPVISLYYAVFFAQRSILLSSGTCLYFCDKKPMRADITLGGSPSQLPFKGAGSSHIAAARVFKARFPTHPLNGQIDFEDAVDWMRALREKVNYNNNEMNLDDSLSYFARVDRFSIRKTLVTLQSNLSLYAFLPDEAALALPIYALELARDALSSDSKDQARPLVSDITKRVSDPAGLISIATSWVP